MKAQEIVLPDGRFARFEPITWADMMVASDSNPHAMYLKLAARVVTIDGEHPTVSELMAMELDLFYPIISILEETVRKIVASTKSKAK